MYDKYFYSELDNFCKIYNVTELDNMKLKFKYFCFKYIFCARKWKLPEIKLNEKNESVLIEFRKVPHIEFIIRNVIHKLGNNWSHTIVCGNLNYDMMKEISTSISPNIKIIKIDKNNISIDDYSLLITTKHFWEQLNGEKILIYQDDSCLFKNNINDFLKWDYIGAPWPMDKDDTPNSVGNGGLSLRTKKCMLDVIDKIPIKDVKLKDSTKHYMKINYLQTPVEDVYFSKCLQEFNLGLVADWWTAYEFSSESMNNPYSLGGHNFFYYDDKWKERMYSYIVDLNDCNTIKATEEVAAAATVKAAEEAEEAAKAAVKAAEEAARAAAEEAAAAIKAARAAGLGNL